ncbi:MAG: toll/interleukin-1 receptor domain-containing protein [Magnetococcus sp. DMHC-1]
MEYEFDVFLSYSSRDKVVVRNLAKRLKTDGLRVWFDDWVVLPGEPIYPAIEKGMDGSRVGVLILSRHSVGAEWPEMERSTFIFRDPTNKERRFVPLRLDDCTIPGSLKQYSIIDYRKRNKAEYQRLLGVCKIHEHSDPGINHQNKGQTSEGELIYSVKRKEFQRNTERLFRKLKGEIAEVLAGSAAAMMELETGMAQKGIDVVLPPSGNRHDQLAERLIDLDFEAGKDILLQAHENLADIRESAGVRVIEKISRKLIPWLYVAHSSNTPMIDMKWGEVSALGDILVIPAGFSSFADIIMAGLDRREVAWESLERQFPSSRYGTRLSNVQRQPENGPSVSEYDNLRQDLFRRIELPLETVKLSLDGQLKSIAMQLEWMFEKKGVRIYYVCDDRPENQQDGARYDNFLQWIREKFPALAIIKLNFKKFLFRDQSLFNEIRHLILTG